MYGSHKKPPGPSSRTGELNDSGSQSADGDSTRNAASGSGSADKYTTTTTTVSGNDFDSHKSLVGDDHDMRSDSNYDHDHDHDHTSRPHTCTRFCSCSRSRSGSGSRSRSPIRTVKRSTATSSIVIPVSGNKHVQSTSYLHKSKRGFPAKQDVNSKATSAAATHIWQTKDNAEADGVERTTTTGTGSWDSARDDGKIPQGKKTNEEDQQQQHEHDGMFHNKIHNVIAKLDTALRDSSGSPSLTRKLIFTSPETSTAENPASSDLSLTGRGDTCTPAGPSVTSATFATSASEASSEASETPTAPTALNVDLPSYSTFSESSSSGPASPLPLLLPLENQNQKQKQNYGIPILDKKSLGSTNTAHTPTIDDFSSTKTLNKSTSKTESEINSSSHDIADPSQIRSYNPFSQLDSTSDVTVNLKSDGDPQRLAFSITRMGTDCSHNEDYPSRITSTQNESEKLYSEDQGFYPYLNTAVNLPVGSSSYFTAAAPTGAGAGAVVDTTCTTTSTTDSTSSAPPTSSSSSAIAVPSNNNTNISSGSKYSISMSRTQLDTTDAGPVSSPLTTIPATANGNYVFTTSSSPGVDNTTTIYASSNKSCPDIASNNPVTITLSGSPELPQNLKQLGLNSGSSDDHQLSLNGLSLNMTVTPTAVKNCDDLSISASGSDSDAEKSVESETSAEKGPHNPRASIMVRKKSGELVKPSLKLIRHHSLPSSPNKAVHFDTNLVSVRRFKLGERPIAVSSADNSPTSEPVTFHWHDDTDTETSDDDSDSRGSGGLFSGFDRKRGHEWAIKTPNFNVAPKTADQLKNEDRMVFLDKLFLSSDKQNLIGHIYVKNICYSKSVSIRFSVDYWKTVTEVFAEFNNEISQQPAPKPHRPPLFLLSPEKSKSDASKMPMPSNGRRNSNDSISSQTEALPYDRFTFVLKLQDLPQYSLLHNSMFFCIRYQANGKEYWDNNNSRNYEVILSKVAKGYSHSIGSSVATEAATSPSSDLKPNLIIKGTNRVQTRRRNVKSHHNGDSATATGGNAKSSSLADSKLDADGFSLSSSNDSDFETNGHHHRRSKTAYSAPYDYDYYGDYEVDDSDFADLRGITGRANKNSDFAFSKNTPILGSSKPELLEDTHGSGKRTAGQVKAKKKLTSRYSFGASWNDLFNKNQGSATHNNTLANGAANSAGNGEYSESESETGGLKKLFFPNTTSSMPSDSVQKTTTASEDSLLSTSVNPDGRPAWDSTLYQDIIKKYCFFKEPPSPSLPASVSNDNSHEDSNTGRLSGSGPGTVDGNITAAPTLGVIRRGDSNSSFQSQNKRPSSAGARVTGFSLEDSMSRSSISYNHNQSQFQQTPKVPGELLTPKSSSPSLQPTATPSNASSPHGTPRGELNELRV